MIKILHIDNHYEIFYILIEEGALIQSSISIECAISMLKKDWFDLILSEPQHLAILTSGHGDEEGSRKQYPYPGSEINAPGGKETR